VIFLARHGQTDDNVEPVRVQGSRDVPLNEAGRAQARELAARVRAQAPDLAALWSSQLQRARETAEIVGADLGLEPRVDPRLAETARGDWEGRRWEEIEAEDPDGVAAWRRAGATFRFPGGESLAEQQARVLAALEDVRRAGAGTALVVCHGGSIRVALCAGDPRGLDAFHAWDVPNGALVRL
jgi:broad specificity phosphatase PhoE